MYGEFNLEKMYQINHVICYVLAWHMYSETSSLSYSTNATLKTKFINSFVESSDSSIISIRVIDILQSSVLSFDGLRF